MKLPIKSELFVAVNDPLLRVRVLPSPSTRLLTVATPAMLTVKPPPILASMPAVGNPLSQLASVNQLLSAPPSFHVVNAREVISRLRAALNVVVTVLAPIGLTVRIGVTNTEL